MTPKTKLPKLLECPVCGKIPETEKPYLPGGLWHITCIDGTKHSWHELHTAGRTLRIAVDRWNKMVSK